MRKPAGTLAEAKEGDKTRKCPRGTAMAMTLQNLFCHSNQNTRDSIGRGSAGNMILAVASQSSGWWRYISQCLCFPELLPLNKRQVLSAWCCLHFTWNFGNKILATTTDILPVGPTVPFWFFGHWWLVAPGIEAKLKLYPLLFMFICTLLILLLATLR